MERLLRSIHRGRYWPIGSGTAKKSCLFFDDAAEALVQASGTERAVGGTFVVAPPAPVTLDEIHSFAFAAFGRRPPPAIPLAGGDHHHSLGRRGFTVFLELRN